MNKITVCNYSLCVVVPQQLFMYYEELYQTLNKTIHFTVLVLPTVLLVHNIVLHNFLMVMSYGCKLVQQMLILRNF